MRRSDVERLTPSSAATPDKTATTRKCSTPKSMPSVSRSQQRPSTSRVIPEGVSVATSLATPVTTRKRSSPHSSSSSSSHYRLSSSSVDAFPIKESKKQTKSAIPSPPQLMMMMMMPPLIPQFGVASKNVSLLDDDIIDDKVERVMTMPNPKSYWQTSLELIVPCPAKDEEASDTTYCTKKG
jgi:hypothetical protein